MFIHNKGIEILLKACNNIVLAVIFMFTVGCAGGPCDLQVRHQPKKEPPFDYQKFKNVNFKAYIEKSKKIIKEHNITEADITRNADELQAISPYQMESEGYDACQGNQCTGVLLIHGLTDTPYLMRDIAESLVENNDCMLVRSIVLPGHATVPGDLLNIEYSDWIEATNYGVKSFADDGINNIFIAGFSTGGALALNFAIHDATYNNKSINLKGLLLFSPAIEIKPRGGFLTNWHKLVSWASPERAWFDIYEDKDFAKYESFPKNAADQIHLLSTQKIDTQIKSVLSTPLFVVISQDDDTINSEITEQFFNNRANNQSQLIIYKRDATNHECKFSACNKICKRCSIYDDYDIVSFSHTAIPVDLNNPHYGKDGKYKSCYHYFDKKKYDEKEYENCKSDENCKFVLGEKSLYSDDIVKKPVRRLTFNPDFKYMTTLMNEFVASYRY